MVKLSYDWLYQEQKCLSKQPLGRGAVTLPIPSSSSSIQLGEGGVIHSKPWYEYRLERLMLYNARKRQLRHLGATGLDFPYRKLPPLTLLVQPKWQHRATATGIQQLCILHLISKASITFKAKKGGWGRELWDVFVCVLMSYLGACLIEKRPRDDIWDARSTYDPVPYISWIGSGGS